MRLLSAFTLLLVVVGFAPSCSSYTPIQLAVVNSMHETCLRNKALLHNMAEVKAELSNRPITELELNEVEEDYARLYEYRPIGFGHPTPFTRRDSINEVLPTLTQQNVFLEEELRRQAAEKEEDGDELVSGTSMTKAELRARIVTSLRSHLERNRRQMQQSTTRASHQIIGYRLLHVCRQGAQLDSGYFVVYTKGVVTVPAHFIAVGF
jgi:hypothetical protein